MRVAATSCKRRVVSLLLVLLLAHLLLLLLLRRGDQPPPAAASAAPAAGEAAPPPALPHTRLLGSPRPGESPCVGVGGGTPWAWQAVYTVVIDAGATATRAHVFSFLRCCIDNTFLLQKEDYFQEDDSLLHYVHAPHQMRALLVPLLRRARAVVPEEYVKHTPLILRATPSLRRLPRAHATRLIHGARKIVTRTPFMVRREHVTIMAGHDEAADLWLAANFLTGRLYQNKSLPLATAELGGGTLQVTIPLPGPPEHIRRAIEKRRQERLKQGDREGGGGRLKPGDGHELNGDIKKNVNNSPQKYRSDNDNWSDTSGRGTPPGDKRGGEDKQEKRQHGRGKGNDGVKSEADNGVSAARGGTRSVRVAGEGQVREMVMMRRGQEVVERGRKEEEEEERGQEEAQEANQNDKTDESDSRRVSSTPAPPSATHLSTSSATHLSTSSLRVQEHHPHRHQSGAEIQDIHENLQTSEVRYQIYNGLNSRDNLSNSSAGVRQNMSSRRRGEQRIKEENRQSGRDSESPQAVTGDETISGLTPRLPGAGRDQEGREVKADKGEQEEPPGKAVVNKSRKQEEQYSGKDRQEETPERLKGSSSSLHGSPGISKGIRQGQPWTQGSLDVAQDTWAVKEADDSIGSSTRESHSHPRGWRPLPRANASRIKVQRRRQRKGHKKINQKKPERRKKVTDPYIGTGATTPPEIALTNNNNTNSPRHPSATPRATSPPPSPREALTAAAREARRGSPEDNHRSHGMSTTTATWDEGVQLDRHTSLVNSLHTDSLPARTHSLNSNHNQRAAESPSITWQDSERSHRKDPRKGRSQERETTAHEMGSTTSEPPRGRQGDVVIIGGTSHASHHTTEGDSVIAYLKGTEERDNRGERNEMRSSKGGTVRETGKKDLNDNTTINEEKRGNEKNEDRNLRRKRRKYGYRSGRRTHYDRRQERQQHIANIRPAGWGLQDTRPPEVLNSTRIHTPQEVRPTIRASEAAAAARKRPDGFTRRRASRRGQGRLMSPNTRKHSHTINRNNNHYSLKPSGGATPVLGDGQMRLPPGMKGPQHEGTEHQSKSLAGKNRKRQAENSLQIEWSVRGGQALSLGVPANDVIIVDVDAQENKKLAKFSDYSMKSDTRQHPRRLRHYRRLHRRWKTLQGRKARGNTRAQQKKFYEPHRFSGPAEGRESATRRKSDRRNRRQLANPFLVASEWPDNLQNRYFTGHLSTSPHTRKQKLKARKDIKESLEYKKLAKKKDINTRLNQILKHRRKRETMGESRDKSQQIPRNARGWRNVSKSAREKKGDLRCKEREALALIKEHRGTKEKLKESSKPGEHCQNTESLPWMAEMAGSSCNDSKGYTNQSLLHPPVEAPQGTTPHTSPENRRQNKTVLIGNGAGAAMSDHRTRRELRNLFDAPNITYRCSPLHKYWLFASSVPMGVYPVRVKVLQRGSLIRLGPGPAGVPGEAGPTTLPPPTTTHHRSDIPPEEEYTELNNNTSDADPQPQPTRSSSASPSTPSSTSSASPRGPPTPPRPPHTPPMRITSKWMEETLAKVKTVVDSILQSIGSARDEQEKKRDERLRNVTVNKGGRLGRRGDTEDVPQQERFAGRRERARRIKDRQNSRRRTGLVETPNEAADGEKDNGADRDDINSPEEKNGDRGREGETEGEGRGASPDKAGMSGDVEKSGGDTVGKPSSYNNRLGYNVKPARGTGTPVHSSTSWRRQPKNRRGSILGAQDESKTISGLSYDNVNRSSDDSTSRALTNSSMTSDSDSFSSSESDSSPRPESNIKLNNRNTSRTADHNITYSSNTSSASDVAQRRSFYKLSSQSESNGDNATVSSRNKQSAVSHDGGLFSARKSSSFFSVKGSGGGTVAAINSSSSSSSRSSSSNNNNNSTAPATELNEDKQLPLGTDPSSLDNTNKARAVDSEAKPSKQAISSVTDLLFTVPNERVIKPEKNSEVQSEIKSTEKLIRTSLEGLLFRVPDGGSRQPPREGADTATATNVEGTSTDAATSSGAPQVHKLSGPHASVATASTSVNDHSSGTLGEKTSQSERTDSSTTSRPGLINDLAYQAKNNIENEVPSSTTENEMLWGDSAGQNLDHMLRTTCLPVGSIGRFKVEDVTYLVTGMGAGAGAEDCWREVTDVVKTHIRLPPLNHTTLLATTAFYFVAASANLIEPNMAYGFVRVGQFRVAANIMCAREPRLLPDPLACLDYQYVAALLTPRPPPRRRHRDTGV
ncbi:uncharacterized protein [Procambarus clarkii]|uniref:uncharacterized protein n=1 Tax=Procambarus clarkii TaxID=6728 RepID=UPI00374419BF